MSDQNQIKNSNKYFSIIPNIIREMGLDAYAISAYFILVSYANNDHICWPSNKTIALKISCSIPTYLKARKLLENKGLIKITERIDDKLGDKTTLIEILDIWKENILQFSDKKGVNQINGGSKGDLHEEDTLREEEPFNKKKEIPFQGIKKKGTSPLQNPPPKKDFSLKIKKEEEEKLIQKLGKEKTEDYKSRLLNYIYSIGKDKYKSHYHTILNWIRSDEDKINRTLPPSSAVPPSQIEANKKLIQQFIDERLFDPAKEGVRRFRDYVELYSKFHPYRKLYWNDPDFKSEFYKYFNLRD